MSTRTIQSPHPIDLGASLRPLAMGGGDPVVRIEAGEALVATRTVAGPATIRLSGSGTTIAAEAWGPGAEAALEAAPALCGAHDDLTGFDPEQHPRVAHLARAHSGRRVIRSGAVVEALLRAVLGQKVTTAESKRSYRLLVEALGEPAPGPGELTLAPAPERLAGLAYHRFHPFGIERRRAETILRIARRAKRMEEAATLPLPDAYRRLEAIPGVGPWSSAYVGLVALGDPDAVPVGDFHIPNTVAWVLAGEERGTDERMLELLAPFAGHRGRVIGLIKAAGVHAPRYGPRAPRRSFERS